jgi:glutamate-1-semialdehyde 2,1-aminomutase
LEAKIKSLGYFCFRGSENNVLNRFYEAAKSVKADVITRITGDCPLIDPELVDRCIDGFKNSKVDYFSNTYPRSYPDGLDVSVMTFKSIEQANKKSQSSYDKEHISNYIINSREFLKSSLQNKENLSHLRWTVDNKCDLKFVESVFNYFSPNIYFKWNEILNFQKLIYEK